MAFPNEHVAKASDSRRLTDIFLHVGVLLTQTLKKNSLYQKRADGSNKNALK